MIDVILINLIFCNTDTKLNLTYFKHLLMININILVSISMFISIENKGSSIVYIFTTANKAFSLWE